MTDRRMTDEKVANLILEIHAGQAEQRAELRALKASVDSLHDCLDDVQARTRSIEVKVAATSERVSAMDTRLDEHTGRIALVEAEVKQERSQGTKHRAHWGGMWRAALLIAAALVSLLGLGISIWRK